MSRMNLSVYVYVGHELNAHYCVLFCSIGFGLELGLRLDLVPGRAAASTRVLAAFYFRLQILFQDAGCSQLMN